MALFERDAALAELKTDRMPQIVAMYLGGIMPTDNALWGGVVTAMAEVQRILKVPLEPLEIFSVNPPTPAELEELGSKPWVVDPGYEMEGGWLGSFQWASIQLRRRPLIEVKSVKLYYPTITEPIYNVPLDWVYPDKKAGLLQFTPKPTSAASVAPSILAANILSSGGTVPQMVRIRYTAGLTDEHECMPEIKDAIMRLAMFKHMKFLPQSGSISADGLSQSKSIDPDKFHKAILDDLEGIRDRINGPVWSVL